MPPNSLYIDEHFDHKYFTFYMDIPYDKFDEVEGIVKSYGFPEWLIAMETSPRDHIHFLIFTTTIDKNACFNRLVRHFKLKHDAQHGGHRKYGQVKKDLTNIKKFKRYLAKQGMIRGSESQDILQQYIDEQEYTADSGSAIIKQITNQMQNEILRDNLNEYPNYDLKLWILKEIIKVTQDDYNPSKQMINKICGIFIRRNKPIEDYYEFIFNN